MEEHKTQGPKNATTPPDAALDAPSVGCRNSRNGWMAENKAAENRHRVSGVLEEFRIMSSELPYPLAQSPLCRPMIQLDGVRWVAWVDRLLGFIPYCDTQTT